jgi:hypothetical protein
MLAQEADELLIDGMPLENAIVGRDLALRLRAEVQLTEDDDELIDEDVNYARFPKRMYSAEAKLFRKDRTSFLGTYSIWQNEQDLDMSQWSWKMRLPLASGPENVYDAYEAQSASYLSLRYRKTEAVEDSPGRDYWYIGHDVTFVNGVYSYLQYRHSIEDGESVGHQVSEYLSWRPADRIRFGGQAAVSKNQGGDGVRPWYAGLFTTFFLIQDVTALRLDARHSDSREDLQYDEYKVYLYQKIGGRSLLRLSFRQYEDTEDRSSQAYGVKAKYFFSPRMSTHIGYRFYEHSEGADYDTFYAGLNILL